MPVDRTLWESHLTRFHGKLGVRSCTNAFPGPPTYTFLTPSPYFTAAFVHVSNK